MTTLISEAPILPQQTQSLLSFAIQDLQPWFCAASITVPAALVDRLYQQALHAQRQHVSAQGFAQYNAPLDYIAQTYKHNITEHIKEFLFKYAVINFLYDQLRQHKIVVAGEPRLSQVTLEPTHDAVFHFELSLFPKSTFHEWKYFPFKAPKRKNYKDLDRQVDSFVSEEQALKEKHQNAAIKFFDWVHFTLIMLDDKQQPIFGTHAAHFWLRMGDEEADRSFNDLFIGKKVGDRFNTTNRSIQEYLSDPFAMAYNYQVSIIDVIPHAYFCLDLFKHHFRLKTNKELYQKFIEVYSYRNDLSLRRAMAEESLKVLLSKHPFDVPNYLVLRQQKILLNTVQENPDYYVYRMQKDFKERIRELAYKQAQEQIFIDQLSFNEGISATSQDVKSYLHLTIRPRIKEFIYFDPPMTKLRGQEMPIPASELLRTCVREKTLNHIIYHLTKK